MEWRLLHQGAGQNTNDRPPLHRALWGEGGVVRNNLSTVPEVTLDRLCVNTFHGG